jgi:signal transduction histidine kinase
MAFAVSAALAALAIQALLVIAGNLISFWPFGAILRSLVSTFGAPLLVIAAFLVFLVAAWFITTAPTLRYLKRISQTVNSIAQGNLEARVSVDSKDELGILAADINTMAANLKQARDEERNAERTKTELVTSVSHDLRTPLTSVLGYLELADQDQYHDEVELRHYIKVAHNKAQDLKNLIDDLFEFSLVSYGGLKMNLESVNLGRLLEQLVEEFVPMFQKSGLEYRLSLPEQKVMVRADANVMVRVFENLVSNAIRYGAKGRFIDIELGAAGSDEDASRQPSGLGGMHQGNAGLQSGVSGEWAGVGGESAGACAEWAVARIGNYGPPIPESQLGLIFERFYRVEGSRSRDTGGAGLGLAIARNMIALHGGTIRAYNDNGRRRTVFEVKIPSLLCS